MYCVAVEMRSRSGTMSPVRRETEGMCPAIPRSSSVLDLLERHAAISRQVTGSFRAGELVVISSSSRV